MTHHPKSSNRTMHFRLPPRQNQRRTRAPKAPPIASGGPGGQGPPGAAGPPPQGGGPAAKTPVLATAAGQSHIPAQGQSRTSWEKGVAEAQAAIDRDKPGRGARGGSFPQPPAEPHTDAGASQNKRVQERCGGSGGRSPPARHSRRRAAAMPGASSPAIPPSTGTGPCRTPGSGCPG